MSENPNPGIAGAAVGSVVGFGVGKAVEFPIGRTIDPRSWSTPDWVNVGNGLSRWNAPSPIPGMVSGVFSSGAQEPVGNKVKDKIGSDKK